MFQTFSRNLADWMEKTVKAIRASGAAAAPASAAPSISPHEAREAEELFSRVADITSSVAIEVQQHRGQLQTLRDELGSIQPGDVAAVAAAVGQLLAINEQAQHGLARAELRLEGQMRQLAETATAAKSDPLTGLANRRGVEDELAIAVGRFEQSGRPAAVLLLDIDQFQQFNDAHGIEAGDQALKRLAGVLVAQAREADAVARISGEEFAVVLHGTKAASVLERAENLRRAICQTPILVAGKELQISASGGLAELQEGDTSESVLKRANEALYAAKLDGRNCCYWQADDRLQRLSRPAEEQLAGGNSADSDSAKTLESAGSARVPAGPRHASVELAADQFADPSFIGQVSRRAAEWRRGGATFSVVLVRVSFPTSGAQQVSEEARKIALRIIHQFARASLRDMDLVARWCDDGLALLLPGSLVTDAAGVANRLRTAIEKHEMPAPHTSLKLSLSAGVAEVIEANDAQRVLQRAWTALESAVSAGGGQVFLHDGLRPALVG
ncbi:MAG: diguanylate cyclase [Planctomycetaceae bacterium]|nr:diguanylate cyclase [Planctomycetaceae bacterium]